jgi:hypothetical protein
MSNRSHWPRPFTRSVAQRGGRRPLVTVAPTGGPVNTAPGSLFTAPASKHQSPNRRVGPRYPCPRGCRRAWRPRSVKPLRKPEFEHRPRVADAAADPKTWQPTCPVASRTHDTRPLRSSAAWLTCPEVRPEGTRIPHPPSFRPESRCGATSPLARSALQRVGHRLDHLSDGTLSRG